ncbi:hypothetical protein, partial [Flagellimonas flava]|uniref:hypothetical protein n=1 Tax=Flagellimonas flava TaxID=570519 RepID=UPI003D656DFE
MNKAEAPILNTKQDIVYERALVETGVKECTHPYTVAKNGHSIPPSAGQSEPPAADQSEHS